MSARRFAFCRASFRSPPAAVALLLAVGAGGAAAAATAPAPPVAALGGAVRVAAGDAAGAALPAVAATHVESAAGTADRWFAAAIRPDRSGLRLRLLAGDRSIARELPAPGGRRARLRLEPVVLAAGGELRGLAWLEGDARGALAVRYARRIGAGWGPPRTVARPGPGSQLALAGTLLDDGSTLLAWTRFDGEDDEIFWSVGRDDAWSAPRRLGAGNRVPDVTPALTAVAGGALAAWSRYDGSGYRTVVSRFDGTRWSTPRPIAATGSLYPSFAPAADGPALLLFRTAGPSGWGVVELDAEGALRRRARVSGGPADRPLVRTAPGGVELLWPAGGTPPALGGWEYPP